MMGSADGLPDTEAKSACVADGAANVSPSAALARPSSAHADESPPYLRAENEDDDGYDPYSDRRSEPPLFERDPWR